MMTTSFSESVSGTFSDSLIDALRLLCAEAEAECEQYAEGCVKCEAALKVRHFIELAEAAQQVTDSVRPTLSELLQEFGGFPDVSGHMKSSCVACGEPYKPSVAVAPYACNAFGPMVMTSSTCKCGGNTFKVSISS